MNTIDLIDYEGKDVAELRKDFESAMDHYLEFCHKKGGTPNQ